jgi:hypothetical protein
MTAAPKGAARLSSHVVAGEEKPGLTALAACALLVDQARQLSNANRAIAALEAERAFFRDMALAAVHLLHDQDVALGAAARLNSELRDELRRYSARAVREVAA